VSKVCWKRKRDGWTQIGLGAEKRENSNSVEHTAFSMSRKHSLILRVMVHTAIVLNCSVSNARFELAALDQFSQEHTRILNATYSFRYYRGFLRFWHEDECRYGMVISLVS
jgi:hypothetical protein